MTQCRKEYEEYLDKVFDMVAKDEQEEDDEELYTDRFKLANFRCYIENLLDQIITKLKDDGHLSLYTLERLKNKIDDRMYYLYKTVIKGKDDDSEMLSEMQDRLHNMFHRINDLVKDVSDILMKKKYDEK